jgi:hypothetical protein
MWVPANAGGYGGPAGADGRAPRCPRAFARAEKHSNRPARRRVVSVDWQEAALVVMGVEQRELPMAVNDIHRIVDIERDRSGRHDVAAAIIYHHPHQADEVAQ